MFYAVKKGKTPGIYTSWGECSDNVTGYPGAVYQKFAKIEDAKAFIGKLAVKDIPEKEVVSAPKRNDDYSSMPVLTLYTDGACSPNPGLGGYGYIVAINLPGGGLEERNGMGGYKMTTNNRMELLGVIAGLESLSEPSIVTVQSDSSYVCNAFTKNWIDGWKKKNFSGVKNPDLWKRLLAAIESHDVNFYWIKGHAGHPYNEACDRLAVKARNQKFEMLSDDTGYNE